MRKLVHNSKNTITIRLEQISVLASACRLVKYLSLGALLRIIDTQIICDD